MSEPNRILLTGGTGSFGHAFARRILARDGDCTLCVYSRDELKQVEMARRFSDERLRFFIGDVRDGERLRRAMADVDLVVHAAAMKQVPVCEYNPAEAVKTNVVGGMNLVEAAIDAGVDRVVALSTDKAVNPANLYGATKLCMEKIFVHGNAYAGPGRTRFSAVRYGNVIGSRGSVIPLFVEQARSGVLTITDRRMTRFWLTLEDAVDFVLHAVGAMRGGEIFVPRIPSMRITDLAEAIAPEAVQKEIGLRPGEKIHEALLTPDEARSAREYERHFVVEARSPRGAATPAREPRGGRPVAEGFAYTSDSNSEWLDVERLREMVGQWAEPPTRSGEKPERRLGAIRGAWQAPGA